MKIYVTGYRGHVGKALVEAGFFPLECDATSPFTIEEAVHKCAPDLVLHLASKSNVDWCENPENHRDLFNVNILGTRNVFEILKAYKIPGVLLSTDQVWGGGWFKGEYKENSKKTAPVNQYGLSKIAAEAFAQDFGGKIIRTSFLFDSKRPEIASKLFELGFGNPVEVPAFMKRSFLYLPDFIGMVQHYCRHFDKMPPVLHLAGSKTVSWYTFMKEVAKVYGYKQSLIIPRRKDNHSGAPRPKNAGLNTDLARSLRFGNKDYKTGIQRMKDES